MDSRTGHIYPDVSDEEAKKRDLVLIPNDQLEGVINMNRKQRRAWAAQQRRSGSPTSSDAKGET
jgi:hypothetical protein